MPRTPRFAKTRKRRGYSMQRFVSHRILTLERITSKNLAKAIAAAWEICPYETHAEGFWPEVAYKMAIEQRNPRFAYYLARDTEKIVGITGHDPAEDGQPEMWLGWFGVLPTERRKGYGSKILLATCEIIGGFGISSLYIYSGDREEERAAHRLYLRNGFEQIGRGKVDGDPVLYFKTKLPLIVAKRKVPSASPASERCMGQVQGQPGARVCHRRLHAGQSVRCADRRLLRGRAAPIYRQG